ncbi:MAG: Hpt domain-containing protein, partial [Gammaproteobacteria bacterium]
TDPDIFSKNIAKNFIAEFGNHRYVTLAEIYSLELIEKTEKIEEAITSEDINSVRELAHSLISSSHAVGLLQLSSSFQSIQELSKSGNIDQIKKKVLETVALKEKSLIALDEFLSNQSVQYRRIGLNCANT